MFILILVMVIIPLTILITNDIFETKKRDNSNELWSSFNNQMNKKHNMPNKYFFISNKDSNHSTHSNNGSYIWRVENDLVIVKKPTEYNLKKISHKELINQMSKSILNIGDIEYFYMSGDRLSVTTGSGGGSSLGGALVGGVVAGGAGAIIGGRKGVNIDTEILDERSTIIVYNNSKTNKIERIIYSPDSYDVFLELMPEKDLTYINHLKNKM